MEPETNIIGFSNTEDFSAIFGANTFRIGIGYGSTPVGAERVIVNTDTNEIVGSATVANVFSGSLRNMLQEHAANNHHLKREHSEVRPRDLRSFLHDVYAEHGQAVDDTTPFTVIYFNEAEQDAPEVEGTIDATEQDATEQDATEQDAE